MSPKPSATNTSPKPKKPKSRGGDYKDECEDLKADLVGGSGPDHLVGTKANEIICGKGGNDTIEGGGGVDIIFGGEGDDHLIGKPNGPADWLIGDAGDDVLEGNNNGAAPEDDEDFLYGEDGNDVLLGGTLSKKEWMWGGKGNDVMVPTPVTALGGNFLDGGAGKDVAFAVNFSTMGNADLIDLDGDPEISIGTGSCKVKVKMKHSAGKPSTGKVSCSIPWPKKVSGLAKVAPISGSVDKDGKVNFDAELYNGLAKLSISDWKKVVKAQASVADDSCVCDPLVPWGTVPEDPSAPADFSE